MAADGMRTPMIAARHVRHALRMTPIDSFKQAIFQR